MPAIPDTIRRLIISFSRYYDIIAVAAPKNRYNGEHGSRDPAYYVCAPGKECNSRTLLRELLEGGRYRSRNIVLSFERYGPTMIRFEPCFLIPLSLFRGKFTFLSLCENNSNNESLLRIIERGWMHEISDTIPHFI